ncbi:hypothetical protein Tco_0286987 [Tanacetum coccineum]
MIGTLEGLWVIRRGMFSVSIINRIFDVELGGCICALEGGHRLNIVYSTLSDNTGDTEFRDTSESSFYHLRPVSTEWGIERQLEIEGVFLLSGWETRGTVARMETHINDDRHGNGLLGTHYGDGYDLAEGRFSQITHGLDERSGREGLIGWIRQGD